MEIKSSDGDFLSSGFRYGGGSDGKIVLIGGFNKIHPLGSRSFNSDKLTCKNTIKYKR